MRVEICWQSVLQIAAVFSCICLFIPDSWQPWCILGAGAGESVICHRNEAWAFTGPGEQAAADANTGIILYCGPLTTDLQISTQSICIFQWQILTFLHLFSPSKKIKNGYIHFVKHVICFILYTKLCTEMKAGALFVYSCCLFECGKLTFFNSSHQLRPKPFVSLYVSYFVNFLRLVVIVRWRRICHWRISSCRLSSRARTTECG